MKVLVDMNLSPDWTAMLGSVGWEAVHWSSIGNPRAPDAELMGWARENGFVVFTHDLDFGTALALTQAAGPSVVQVRTKDVTPDAIGGLVIAALRQFQTQLEEGALVAIDESQTRARILPLNR